MSGELFSEVHRHFFGARLRQKGSFRILGGVSGLSSGELVWSPLHKPSSHWEPAPPTGEDEEGLRLPARAGSPCLAALFL